MEATYDITPSDIRHIASSVVLRNGAEVLGGRPRDLVAQLSKVLCSVKIAPAAPPFEHITLNNPGAFFAGCRAAFEDYERRCALYMGMASGEISADEAFDIVCGSSIVLEDYGLEGYEPIGGSFPLQINTNSACGELTDLWRNDAPPDAVRAWARVRALAALTEYANEYAAGGMLRHREELMSMLREVRAYVPSPEIVAAFLLMLAAVPMRSASELFLDRRKPPDIWPVVSLLCAAVVLAPRAPQRAPSMACLMRG